MIKATRILIISLLLTTLHFGAFAQRFYDRNEYGIMAGAAQYFGDLNPEYGFKTVRPATGVFYRYYFNPYISTRVNLGYVQLAGKDSDFNNPFQKIRNLSFKNNIIEASVLGEFNFFYFMTGDKYRRLTPYMVFGLGAIYSDPFVDYNGRKEYLRPLHTEGQNLSAFKDRKYNKINMIMPFGAGVKYWLRPGINFGLELVHRFAFTDYLDDVSQTYVGEQHFLLPNGMATKASILQDRSTPVNGNKFGIAGRQRGDNATIDQYLMIQFGVSFQLKSYHCPSDNPLWNQ
ncbi:MAG TPA: DUF6089 family protein [Edaphocola sp.]|nr:DUF6089 family protein [Edaphocola sp.]